MSWYYTYGFFAGAFSLLIIQESIAIGILFVIAFGLVAWVIDSRRKA